MSEISVRLAAAEDRAACAAIYARTWPLAHPGLQRAINDAIFDLETEEEIIFVAVRDDGAVVGFAAYYSPSNFLHHLYVDQSEQGGGVGSALLKTVQDHAAAGLRLKVTLSNHRARAFYTARDWIEGETGDGDYGSWILLTAP